MRIQILHHQQESSLRKRKNDKNKTGEEKKRGAPKGHRGATRLKPEPDQTTDVIADECEQCGSKNIQDLDELKKRIIEDFLYSQETTVTQFDRHKMKCMDCGHEFISKHPDCPKKGKFGISLLVHITMLKFHLRGVLRRIQDFLFFKNDFTISTKGIHDILLRAGDVCKITYEERSDQAKELSEVIHLCFDNMKAFLETNPSMSERKKQKTIFEDEMKNIIERYSHYKELDEAITYLKNGIGKWYTCLLYPGMEPTNNYGEQAMREHVIMRKIIGCFRSKRGAENYQYIASLLASWKLQDINMFKELENLLRKKLCMS